MAWGYKATITVDHTKVSATDHTSFPMLVSGTYDGTGSEPDLRVTGSGGKVTSANGYDICFYSDSGLTTKLDHEIDTYTSTTGAIKMWVRIPTLHTGSDDVIYMAYGDASITTSQENINSVWDSYYKAVWHFKSASDFSDSTSNAHTLTNGNSDFDSASAIGGGRVGDGSAKHLYVGTHADWDMAGGEFTWQMFLKPNELATDYRPLMRIDVDGGNYRGIYWMANDKLWWGNYKGTGSDLYDGTYSTSTLSTSRWDWIGIRRIGDSWAWIFNGSAEGTATQSGSVATMNGTLYFMKNATYSTYANANIDEIRISKGIGRSTGWVLTEYNNYVNTSTFYAMGNETATNAAPNAPTNSTPADSATGVSRNPTLTCSAFSDSNVGDTHAGSQWLVATDSGFTDTVWDSGDTATNLTSVVVNATNGTFGGTRSGKTRLASSTEHYWKVRHKDNNGSWSNYS